MSDDGFTRTFLIKNSVEILTGEPVGMIKRFAYMPENESPRFDRIMEITSENMTRTSRNCIAIVKGIPLDVCDLLAYYKLLEAKFGDWERVNQLAFGRTIDGIAENAFNNHEAFSEMIDDIVGGIDGLCQNLGILVYRFPHCSFERDRQYIIGRIIKQYKRVNTKHDTLKMREICDCCNVVIQDERYNIEHIFNNLVEIKDYRACIYCGDNQTPVFTWQQIRLLLIGQRDSASILHVLPREILAYIVRDAKQQFYCQRCAEHKPEINEAELRINELVDVKLAEWFADKRLGYYIVLSECIYS